MTLRNEMDLIIQFFGDNKHILDHNSDLIEIYDGNLKKFVLEALKAQLSEKTFEVAKHRVAPINLLKKIIQKLSPIYNPAPARRVVDGNESDSQLFNWYVEKINPNKLFWQAVRQYSLCRSCLVQVVPDKMQPVGRVILNDRFFVISTDTVNPMRPTHVVFFEKRRVDDKVKWVFTAYTETEFLIFDEEKKILQGDMAALGNPDGLNPYNRLPFVYATESEANLFPCPDSDMMAMTKLIPVILSDLNYAIMFQCFSIFYAMNAAKSEMVIGPNVLWNIQKDQTATGEPEVGVIKGNVDYDGVMTTLQSQLAMWLNSKGIRPGAIGSLQYDSFANGISKMIDEMDTVELRRMLTDAFQVVEQQFWDNLLHVQHPIWVLKGEIENRTLFSPKAKIETVFSTQEPMYPRGQLVKDLQSEVEAKFTTRKIAIQKLNPLLTEEEVDDLILKIDEEAQKNINNNPLSVGVGDNGTNPKNLQDATNGQGS